MDIPSENKCFMWFIIFVSVFLAVEVAWETPARAQEPFETVHAVAMFTMRPRDVRSIGMGGTGVSELAGGGLGYYNPASLAWNEAFTFEGSYYEYVFDSDFYETGVSGYWRPGGGKWDDGFRFGWAASYWAYVIPDWTERDIYNPEGTDISGIQFYYLTASLAAAWKKGIFEVGAGESTKFMEMTQSGTSMWAFDLGVIAAAVLEGESGWWMRPRLGLSAMDLGSGYTSKSGIDVDYIRRYRIGAGLDFKAPQTRTPEWAGGREIRVLGISAGFDLVFDDAGDDDYLEKDGMYAAGLELTLYEVLHLRAGTSNRLFLMKDAAALGIGLEWFHGRWVVKADYGLVLDDTLIGDVSLDSFRLLFGWR